MTEAELTIEIVVLANSLGLLWHRCRDSRYCEGRKGVPDLLIAGPRGLILPETKSEDGETSADQDLWWWTIHAGHSGHPCPYRLWRPSDLESGRIRQELEAIALSRGPGHMGA